METLSPFAEPDAFLRALFDRAVAAADPMLVVPGHMRPRPPGRVVVIGAGKASALMAEAVEREWGPCEGIVITRYGHARPCRGIEIVEADHPVPDAAGVAATERILSLVRRCGPDDTVLCLISGGASALLVAPVEGVTLEEKQALTRALLFSGASIAEVNAVRRALSRVKGGRLAASCKAPILTLLISDVAGDDPAVIGSGPTVPAEDTIPARAVIERYGIDVPDTVRAALDRRLDPVPVHPGSRSVIVAAPSQSLAAAAALATDAGCAVRSIGADLEGEARKVAARHAALAKSLADALRPSDAPVVVLSGGELTVAVRGAGTGGPNAEYALAFALALGPHDRIHAIACDTDGIDGAADFAGAVLGPKTLRGQDAADALSRNDAHGFFARVGGQVVTGPTMTNVNDFRAILILPPSGAVRSRS